jgi:hypothetical protein
LALFRPALRKTTLVTTFLVACSYALASSAKLGHFNMPLDFFSCQMDEQTVGGVELFQELGAIVGRLLFAFLVVRIATERRLLRLFLVRGLMTFSCVYFFAATHSLLLLKYGIFLGGLLGSASRNMRDSLTKFLRERSADGVRQLDPGRLVCPR